MNFSLLKDVEPQEPEQEDSAEMPAQPQADHPAQDQESEAPAEESEFVAAEKKPANQTALMLFAILIIGGAGIYGMYLRVGPRSAKATPPAVAEAETTIKTFMGEGSGNVSLLRKLLDGTADIVKQFKSPQVAQVPLADLKANPFQMTGGKEMSSHDAEELAKKKKEEMRAAAIKAVQGLRLQTVVVHGDRKACMINNTLYQEGDSLEGFVVEHINAKSVIVKNGAYRFELRMTN